ncbi:hypothetical protein L1987_39023 [Smallanthus sonchifolius]|uniref:Uncharacterized protein n=1 Tax=Smallanthus sonchifolius TaxID=185202 RepID=A0ACB9HM03_9ASTR|nr:hypothetical protein L1987_39023 [Smallanthus sonchifolius]
MPEIETVPEITAVNEPLLPPSQGTVPAQSDGGDSYSTRVQTLLGLFAGRRGASLLVRQNVALYLEDWREAWGYSLPVVVIDTLSNLTFVVVALAMLLWFAREETNVKLRIWICGYSMQCVVHVVLLVLEYKRRISTAPSLISRRWSSEDDEDDIHPIRIFEKLNTVISYIWLVIGFIWMMSSYEDHGSQRIFWIVVYVYATMKMGNNFIYFLAAITSTLHASRNGLG